MNARAQRAKQIMELPDYAIFLDEKRIKVRSQTELTKYYIVERTGNGLVCECLDHQRRRSVFGVLRAMTR